MLMVRSEQQMELRTSFFVIYLNDAIHNEQL